jgi:hypothetical protein
MSSIRTVLALSILKTQAVLPFNQPLQLHTWYRYPSQDFWIAIQTYVTNQRNAMQMRCKITTMINRAQPK